MCCIAMTNLIALWSSVVSACTTQTGRVAFSGVIKIPMCFDVRDDR